MKIFLARHGQSQWQIAKDDKDWNSSLTNLGQKQAQLLPPYAQFKAQSTAALNALVAAADETKCPVLGVAHGGLISTLLRTAVGSDAVSFWIYNTSLSLLEWKRGRWHLVYLNLWDHLPPTLRTY